MSGFKEVKPVVFSSIYPVASDDYQSLFEALEKYKLNDASLTYQKDSSAALGQGFRCGYLGLLHLEIVQERLEREFDQSIVMTMPSVQYRYLPGRRRAWSSVDNPQYYPDPVSIKKTEEPYIKADILIPDRYVGRGDEALHGAARGQLPHVLPTPGRVEIAFDMPLAEVVFDFYDKLKTSRRATAPSTTRSPTTGRATS